MTWSICVASTPTDGRSSAISSIRRMSPSRDRMRATTASAISSRPASWRVGVSAPARMRARSRMLPTSRFSRSVSSRIVVRSSRSCSGSCSTLVSSRLVTPALIEASGGSESCVTELNIAARSWFVSASSCARRARAASGPGRGRGRLLRRGLEREPLLDAEGTPPVGRSTRSVPNETGPTTSGPPYPPPGVRPGSTARACSCVPSSSTRTSAETNPNGSSSTRTKSSSTRSGTSPDTSLDERWPSSRVLDLVVRLAPAPRPRLRPGCRPPGRRS